MTMNPGDLVAFKSHVVRRVQCDAEFAAFRAEVIGIKGSIATVRKTDSGKALLIPIVKLYRMIPVANLTSIKPDGKHIWID